MKDLDEYQRLLENKEDFLKNNKLKYSKFVRSKIVSIKEILDKGFHLKEIISNLENDLKVKILYISFWSSVYRQSKRGKENFTEGKKKEAVEKEPITKKHESVSDEIKDSEKNIELDWINKPEFRQINNPYLIKEIIKYELTEDDIRSLKLPPHPIKCLEKITDLGERRKAEKIDKIYFGK